jgi:hypothetical protein
MCDKLGRDCRGPGWALGDLCLKVGGGRVTNRGLRKNQDEGPNQSIANGKFNAKNHCGSPSKGLASIVGEKNNHYKGMGRKVGMAEVVQPWAVMPQRKELQGMEGWK